jgi:hypothetical protein
MLISFYFKETPKNILEYRIANKEFIDLCREKDAEGKHKYSEESEEYRAALEKLELAKESYANIDPLAYKKKNLEFDIEYDGESLCGENNNPLHFAFSYYLAQELVDKNIKNIRKLPLTKAQVISWMKCSGFIPEDKKNFRGSPEVMRSICAMNPRLFPSSLSLLLAIKSVQNDKIKEYVSKVKETKEELVTIPRIGEGPNSILVPEGQNVISGDEAKALLNRVSF